MTDENVIQGEAVEDARTGELIPKGSPPELRPGILAQININQVGTLDVGEDAMKVLEEPLNPEDVLIRPDGLVYLPWTWYANRLNRAFGKFKWGVIPQGSPMIKDMGNKTLVVWLNWLVVKGIPVAMAGGETSYDPKNFSMSYGDAVEGARSNSLARNCKMLGMSLEMWDAEWVSAWKKRYAETYKGNNDKTYWRKKGSKNGSQPKQAEKVETAVGYVSKEAWDEHAERLAKDADQSDAVKASEVGEKKYKVSELTQMKTFDKIVEKSGKKKSEVAAVIGGLQKGTSYSISDVVKLLIGEKEDVNQ